MYGFPVVWTASLWRRTDRGTLIAFVRKFVFAAWGAAWQLSGEEPLQNRWQKGVH